MLMKKFNFILLTLTKLLEFFKGMSCRMGMCCNSECNGGKEKEDGGMKVRWKDVEGLDGDKEDKDE
tara:strand:- start:201 stop:398 length:198 start_codon:yes stop_codon:yes gene_type:complete